MKLPLIKPVGVKKKKKAKNILFYLVYTTWLRNTLVQVLKEYRFATIGIDFYSHFFHEFAYILHDCFLYELMLKRLTYLSKQQKVFSIISIIIAVTCALGTITTAVLALMIESMTTLLKCS